MKDIKNIAENAGLIDYNYKIKGCKIWLPDGIRLLNKFESIIEFYLKKNTKKYGKYQFPIFINKDDFGIEAEHIKEFSSDVYTTYGGKYIIRPTSEVAMYPFFSNRIKSYKDLPFRVYQMVNVYRKETKSTSAFIREREFFFFESHTAERNKKNTLETLKQNTKSAIQVLNSMGIYPCISLRPKYDTFPGAVFSIALDTKLGSKSCQVGTIHYLGHNFSKPFGIQFDEEDGSRLYAYQTCYGLSERLIGVLLDRYFENGILSLPWKWSPIKIKVGFLTNCPEDRISKAQIFLKKVFSECSISEDSIEFVKDQKAGDLFKDQENRGFPILFILGSRELEDDVIMTRTSLDMKKKSIPNTPKDIQFLINEIQKDSKTISSKSSSYIRQDHFGTKYFCGEGCCKKWEELTEGQVLGHPFNFNLIEKDLSFNIELFKHTCEERNCDVNRTMQYNVS